MREDKKPTEFSKQWLKWCIIISLAFTSFSYVLALLDKNPVTELSIAINQILWGVSGTSFLGYTVQNFMRAYSLNKYGTQEVPEKSTVPEEPEPTVQSILKETEKVGADH